MLQCGPSNQIKTILGVTEISKHNKYLGMPATVGKSKKEIFGVLKESIWAKINGWGEKALISSWEGGYDQIRAPSYSYLSYGVLSLAEVYCFYFEERDT